MAGKKVKRRSISWASITFKKGTQREIIYVHFFTDSFTGCDWTGVNTWSCCSSWQPCEVFEGDCDNDYDCLGYLLCGTDNCYTPFEYGADCCYDPFQGKQRFYSNCPNSIYGFIIVHVSLLEFLEYLIRFCFFSFIKETSIRLLTHYDKHRNDALRKEKGTKIKGGTK